MIGTHSTLHYLTQVIIFTFVVHLDRALFFIFFISGSWPRFSRQFVARAPGPVSMHVRVKHLDTAYVVCFYRSWMTICEGSCRRGFFIRQEIRLDARSQISFHLKILWDFCFPLATMKNWAALRLTGGHDLCLLISRSVSPLSFIVKTQRC